MNNLVSLNYLNDYDVQNCEKALEKALEEINAKSLFSSKMTVLIKPCLNGPYSPNLAETTHPNVVMALIKLLTKMGVKCIVADSWYKKYTTAHLDKIYFETGLLEVANLTMGDLNHDLSTTEIDIPTGVVTKKIKVLNVVKKVDAIINVGKLKMDSQFGVIGVANNLFGLVPGDVKNQVLNRLETLADFNNYIIDMVEAFKDKIVLNIIDAIVALEANKTQRMLSLLGVSENMFSLDASLFNILGIDLKNTIISQANDRGLVSIDKPYELVGEKIEKFVEDDFAKYEFNNESKINKNNLTKTIYFMNNQKRVKIYSKKCKGCSVCSKICPTGAIKMKYDKNGELYAHVDYKKCIFCYKCHTACPYKIVDMITPCGYKNTDRKISKYN